jgi:hypothetical protein
MKFDWGRMTEKGRKGRECRPKMGVPIKSQEMHHCHCVCVQFGTNPYVNVLYSSPPADHITINSWNCHLNKKYEFPVFLKCSTVDTKFCTPSKLISPSPFLTEFPRTVSVYVRVIPLTWKPKEWEVAKRHFVHVILWSIISQFNPILID